MPSERMLRMPELHFDVEYDVTAMSASLWEKRLR